VINNLSIFRSTCRLDSSLFLYPERPSLGVVFVAMRRNIADLPGVIELSNRLGAREVLVTNVLPYTVEMSEEILYSRVVRNTNSPAFHLQLPRWDNEKLLGLLPDDLEKLYTVTWNGEDRYSAASCPFILKGSLSINWEGNISPCLPLMYDHTDFLEGQPRFSKSYHVGNVAVDQLNKAWNDSEYVAFREKVLSFDFPPCTACGGCYLWEENEEDCYGNVFPTCGGCLWAQGIVRCP
jgi:MoaA/NifB/PqqE/SkfB family radical SAM enzyme